MINVSYFEFCVLRLAAAFEFRTQPSLFGGSANGSGGNTSPSHRTSIREQDEQLQALKKDNFNLKLRIYFLEDTASKMPNEGKEALLKQIVDLKVSFVYSTILILFSVFILFHYILLLNVNIVKIFVNILFAYLVFILK